MRIGFVVPRYGAGVVGGVERQVRDYATRLAARGHAVEVLTTCATSHFTWRNELRPGTSVDEGVTVRRFRVTAAKDHGLMANLHARLDAGFDLDPAGQRAWVENTGYSDELLEGVAQAHTRTDALVFAPYLFASTVVGVHVRPERSLVVPCLHDEVYARFEPVREAMLACAGLVFNSPAEMRLGERLLGARIPPHRVAGDGFEPPASRPDAAAWRARRGVDGALVAYAGRREQAKNFPLLAAWTAIHSRALARERPVRLAAMGSGPVEAPPAARDWVVDLGVVGEAEKLDCMAASLAVAQLSTRESFSYVVAEAWLSGTAAVVHAACEPTREHCERSGGGVWVESPEEYSAALSMLAADPALRLRMAAQGREYILDEYGWPRVLDRLERAVSEMVR
ncbi:MAG TPA: glycosyltransferase family 4 protein [Candidatus Dormibacteraeota bacterium]|nr:glycosyltransferase family 4 protein [Candidatus Dormibacteraeota bacterium]